MTSTDWFLLIVKKAFLALYYIYENRAVHTTKIWQNLETSEVQESVSSLWW